jgi:hypothetical protein
MSFATSSRKAEDVKQGGSNHIVSSGVYPVTILAPVVSVSKGGSTSVDLYVDHNGQKQIIYGNLRVTNNDGSSNQIGAKIFNQLMIIAGVDEVADPIEADLPIGKKEALKTVAVLDDLCDIDVLMRIQMEYSKYEGKIQEKKVIKAFFRAADNATAEEIVNESDVGAGFEREQKYIDNITYKNGLTPEVIEAWIKGGRKDENVPASAEKKKPSFGDNKRFGNKNKDAA